jgi:hypothetical protein
MKNKVPIIIIAFEEILEEIKYDSNISSTNQVAHIIDYHNAQMISIGNVIMCAEDFMLKFAKIELTLLKQGEDAAAKKWLDLRLPVLVINKFNYNIKKRESYV